MEKHLDPEKLFTTDPNIPEFEEDGIGYQGKPEGDGDNQEPEEKDEPDEDVEAEESDDDESDGDGEDVDGEEDEPENPEGGESEDDKPDGDVFEIDGKEYTAEALSDHIIELEKGSLRQSDYTKKTQELADTRRGVEADVAFVNAVKDADLMDSIAEALETAGVKGAKELVENALNGNAGEHPDTIALAELKGEMDRVESEKEAETRLNAEVESLAERKEIDISEAQKVRQFAEERYEQDGTVLTLDDAYDLYLVRNGKLKVKRKQPTVPKTPSKKSGGKPKGDAGKWDKMSAEHLFTD